MFFKKLVVAINSYIENDGCSLESIASLWRLAKLSDEITPDKISKIQQTIAKKYRSFERFYPYGDDRIDNYYCQVSKVIGVGELIGYDFTPLVRKKIQECLEKNFQKLYAFAFGYGLEKSDLTEYVCRLVELAHLGGFDISEQLKSYLKPYLKAFKLFPYLRPRKMKALIGSYQPIGKTRLSCEFSVDKAVREFFAQSQDVLSQHRLRLSEVI